MERAQAAGLELPRQQQKLVGDLELALGAHGPKPPDLQGAHDRVDFIHRCNVGFELAPGKKRRGPPLDGRLTPDRYPGRTFNLAAGMRPAPVILSLAMWCAYCRGEVTAQSDSTLVRAVARQERIRIQVGAGSKIELRHPRIEGLMLVGQVGPDSARAEYPIQGISQVWRRGSGADAGFMTGAAIGAAMGAAAGIAAANICVFSCREPSGSEQLGAILAGGLLGGATVGTLGALLGAASGDWKSVYKMRAVSAKPIITPQRLGVSLTF